MRPGMNRRERMNNRDIIRAAAIAAGIVTEEELNRMGQAGDSLPFHTASGWKALGYKVRDEEKERGFEVKLWRKKEDKFYLVKSFLYREDQVEKDI